MAAQVLVPTIQSLFNQISGQIGAQKLDSLQVAGAPSNVKGTGANEGTNGNVNWP